MKRAVPVFNNNLEIFERTGQTPFFAIFENEKFIELRENPKHSHHHHEHNQNHEHNEEHTNEHRNQVITALFDVDEILLRKVGEHMQNALKQENVKIIKIRKKHGDKANEVIQKYINGGLE